MSPSFFVVFAMGPYYTEEVVSHRNGVDRSRSFTSLSLWVVATAGLGIPSVLRGGEAKKAERLMLWAHAKPGRLQTARSSYHRLGSFSLCR